MYSFVQELLAIFAKFFLMVILWDHFFETQVQKQPSSGVIIKRCSENMQQIYRRTPMPECDFNKAALQLYWNHTSAWVFSSKFVAYFQNTFSSEHIWAAASAGTCIALLCTFLSHSVINNAFQMTYFVVFFFAEYLLVHFLFLW